MYVINAQIEQKITLLTIDNCHSIYKKLNL